MVKINGRCKRNWASLGECWFMRRGARLGRFHFTVMKCIVSCFDWVAISLRLLSRPPVSHTLTHTHNQLNQIIN